MNKFIHITRSVNKYHHGTKTRGEPMFALEFAVVLIALFIGARLGGIFLGMAGGFGLAILAFVFHLTPTSPPIDVMLIIIAVVLAASTMQAAGGMDFLVQVAEHLLRRNPDRITFVAPFVAYLFTFLSGTGNVVYSLLPVIAEVARESGVRPERPMSISVIASQQAITACPISAATVTMVALLAPFHITLVDIVKVCIPGTLIGVLAGAFVANFMGKNLNEDPEYLERVRQGLIPPLVKKEATKITATIGAKLSVVVFIVGAALVVSFGTLPWLRPTLSYDGKMLPMSMPHTIELTMLVISGVMVLLCKIPPDKIIEGSVFKSGMMGVVCIFGLAWMGDTLVLNNMATIKGSVQSVVAAYPWAFSFALFAVSALIMSQAATVRALVPLGIALGISGVSIVGIFPAVNGYFFIPNYATLVAGCAFDRTGTTKIGKYVLNHSYMLPGLVATSVGVLVSFLLAKVLIIR
jgi:anaerobic C4-dicarboxylate transporter DcuA